MPAAAKGTDERSAKAFARHYFDSINFAARTGDTSQLDTLGSGACESCDAIGRNIRRIYRAGGSIETEGWELRSLSPVPLQPRAKPVLDLSVFVNPETVVPRAGGPEKHYDGGKQAMTMYLAREDARWLVTKLDKVA
jgi:hypothetical protein